MKSENGLKVLSVSVSYVEHKLALKQLDAQPDRPGGLLHRTISEGTDRDSSTNQICGGELPPSELAANLTSRDSIRSEKSKDIYSNERSLQWRSLFFCQWIMLSVSDITDPAAASLTASEAATVVFQRTPIGSTIVFSHKSLAWSLAM